MSGEPEAFQWGTKGVNRWLYQPWIHGWNHVYSLRLTTGHIWQHLKVFQVSGLGNQYVYGLIEKCNLNDSGTLGKGKKSKWQIPTSRMNRALQSSWRVNIGWNQSRDCAREDFLKWITVEVVCCQDKDSCPWRRHQRMCEETKELKKRTVLVCWWRVQYAHYYDGCICCCVGPAPLIECRCPNKTKCFEIGSNGRLMNTSPRVRVLSPAN